MRRETTDLIGSGLLLAALVTATFAELAPPAGASSAPAPQAAKTIAMASGTIERGHTLFFAKGCVACHRKNGEAGAIGSIGPDLTGLRDRAADRRPGMSAEAYVRESIRTPSAFVAPGYGGSTFGMPDLGLSDAEIDAVTAFLLGTP